MNLLNVTVTTARRFIAIDGYDRALALAAKAFVALCRSCWSWRPGRRSKPGSGRAPRW